MESTRKTPQRGQAEAILKYLERNVRLHVHVEDMAKDLDLTKHQVQSALYGLKNVKNLPIQKVMNNVYMYDPAPGMTVTESKTAPVQSTNGNGGPVRRLYEEIGKTKQDRIVLQDEDGNLYVAEAL